MEMHKSEEVLEIKNALLMDFYPENLQNSKLLPYITEHLSFNISDFSTIYQKQEAESLNLLEKCNFLNISGEIVEYNEEEINNIYICDDSFLNDKIIDEIRNIKNVTYSRFYKKYNYKWIFVPTSQSKENFINFVRNKNIKMFNLKKSSIVNNINYLKESNGLKDKRKNSDFSCNGNSKWRKYSKNYNPHKGSHNSSYYNNYYYKSNKGRERFNSDNINNYQKKSNDYYYNNSNNNSNNKTKKTEKDFLNSGIASAKPKESDNKDLKEEINKIIKEKEEKKNLIKKQKKLIEKFEEDNDMLEGRINSIIHENKKIKAKIETYTENQEQLIMLIKIVQKNGVDVEALIDKWNNDVENMNNEEENNEISDNNRESSLSDEINELNGKIDPSSFIPINIEEPHINKKVFSGIPKLNFSNINQKENNKKFI